MAHKKIYLAVFFKFPCGHLKKMYSVTKEGTKKTKQNKNFKELTGFKN